MVICVEEPSYELIAQVFAGDLAGFYCLNRLLLESLTPIEFRIEAVVGIGVHLTQPLQPRKFPLLASDQLPERCPRPSMKDCGFFGPRAFGLLQPRSLFKLDPDLRIKCSRSAVFRRWRNCRGSGRHLHVISVGRLVCLVECLKCFGSFLPVARVAAKRFRLHHEGLIDRSDTDMKRICRACPQSLRDGRTVCWLPLAVSFLSLGFDKLFGHPGSEYPEPVLDQFSMPWRQEGQEHNANFHERPMLAGRSALLDIKLKRMPQPAGNRHSNGRRRKWQVHSICEESPRLSSSKIQPSSRPINPCQRLSNWAYSRSIAGSGTSGRLSISSSSRACNTSTSPSSINALLRAWTMGTAIRSRRVNKTFCSRLSLRFFPPRDRLLVTIGLSLLSGPVNLARVGCEQLQRKAISAGLVALGRRS